MKILNFNVWGGKLFYELITFLKETDADIVTLQEVYHDKNKKDHKEAFRREDGLTYNLLSQIIRKTDYCYSFFSPTASMVRKGDDIDYGNLTLSKYPIRKAETIYYDIEYNPEYTHPPEDYTQEPRNMQKITLQVRNKLLTVINTHGIWQLGKKKSDSDRTMAMCQKILDNLPDNQPTIVCGDFNITIDTKSIALLDSKLTNLCKKHAITNTRNKIKGREEVIDYIFVSEGIKEKDFKVLDPEASDHSGLILDFDF